MSSSGAKINPIWLTVIWIGLVGIGSVVLARYASVPGELATAPETWPSRSTLAAPETGPHLVMLVHPKCPCSRAGLEELARLRGRTPDSITMSVLFHQPDGETVDWAQTDLWKRARGISGIDAVLDPAGREAALFGAKTSGQVLLYDQQGRLTFNGGITPSRGHEGDNGGKAGLTAAITGTSGTSQFPVFGCPLHAEADCPQEKP